MKGWAIMFCKHIYKNLDIKERSLDNYAVTNPVLEFNMEDIAKMVFNSNYGLERFVSYFDDLAEKSGIDWKIKQAKALIEAMNKIQ